MNRRLLLKTLKYVILALLTLAALLGIGHVFGIIVHQQDVVVGFILFTLAAIIAALWQPEDNKEKF